MMGEFCIFAKFSLGNLKKEIFVAVYKTYLPKENEIKRKLKNL